MREEIQHKEVQDIIENSLPHVAIDCVILGYHSEEKSLKVLLLRFQGAKKWVLPGGFILKDEPVEEAAYRVLKNRTGLDNIYLKQFAVFGDPNRSKEHIEGADQIRNPWFNQRFISIGYYALVDYKSVNIAQDNVSEDIQWKEIDALPELGLDHSHILHNGLFSLRESLSLHPVGRSLLPEQFTLPELQSLYEIILGRTLNRGNFYRKIMNYNLLIDTGEIKTTKGHRSPKLYAFNKEIYDDAVKNGLQSIW